ncbi:F-box/kelch-repeat protein At3g23880-like [Argentina anserina]|uniref:F-box/kelch-repeat protein At3g23880-like n=1 Tax=Argentina anserina TaxID=57926 RepID=UPI0021768E3B|nr:F-box/kelch-repeat protein At3g23880-like [Potentilla anserina]XP_050370730.1 F-box/kelch-repeat protein At3g23880-like [Potentilla anserina]XP_050370731.1 F-box/kelch-repeat protein At3g23880-like [Potentilla anserina]
MWDDFCHEGKSLLSPESISKLCLSISLVFTNWVQSLPQEIIPNILIRLPIKSLIKFTSVCKSWNSTIKDPSFILTHLTHKLNINDQNATHPLLLHTVHSEGTSPKSFGRVNISGFKQDSYSLHYDNNDAGGEYCKVEFPVVLKEKLINGCFRLVGTCNGLVLLADDMGEYGYTFVIWNPSVRKYVTLPKPSVRFSTHGDYVASLGLCYDATSNDYKVVRLTTLLDPRDKYPRTLAQVYSLVTGSWGMLSTLPSCVVPHSWVQVFVNGALHWLAIHSIDGEIAYFVLAFDVASETFGEIVLPMSFIVGFPVELKLSVSGDRKFIALFVKFENEGDPFVDIWVMKEFSEEKSWTILNILSLLGPKRSLTEALCFRRSCELVLVLGDSRDLVLLDTVSGEVKLLGISGGQVCSAGSYEESLVLLDREDAASY